MTITAVVVGIDVAQAELVVAVRPTRDGWTVPNDETGIAELVRGLRPLHPALVVLGKGREFRLGGNDSKRFCALVRMKGAEGWVEFSVKSVNGGTAVKRVALKVN